MIHFSVWFIVVDQVEFWLQSIIVDGFRSLLSIVESILQFLILGALEFELFGAFSINIV
jgi:hypothetical protein